MDATTISWNELQKPAGHLLMIGLAEDGSDLWKILRKPEGTFWEVAAIVSWAPTGETLRVDDGDQILDAKKLAKCETLYDKYRHLLLAESDGKSATK
jgi:hypothetical protein